MEEKARIFCCGHEKMREQLAEDPDCRKMLEKTQDGYGSVSCVVFNFGYLPGGAHDLATKAQTSLEAVEQSLELLKREELSVFVSTAGKTVDLRRRKL